MRSNPFSPKHIPNAMKINRDGTARRSRNRPIKVHRAITQPISSRASVIAQQNLQTGPAPDRPEANQDIGSIIP